jgi:hypothetical protein
LLDFKMFHVEHRHPRLSFFILERFEWFPRMLKYHLPQTAKLVY